MILENFYEKGKYLWELSQVSKSTGNVREGSVQSIWMVQM